MLRRCINLFIIHTTIWIISSMTSLTLSKSFDSYFNCLWLSLLHQTFFEPVLLALMLCLSSSGWRFLGFVKTVVKLIAGRRNLFRLENTVDKFKNFFLHSRIAQFICNVEKPKVFDIIFNQFLSFSMFTYLPLQPQYRYQILLDILPSSLIFSFSFQLLPMLLNNLFVDKLILFGQHAHNRYILLLLLDVCGLLFDVQVIAVGARQRVSALFGLFQFLELDFIHVLGLSEADA